MTLNCMSCFKIPNFRKIAESTAYIEYLKGASRNLLLRDGRLDTAMRSIWGGQACCFALPHQRAAPHRVARAPQGAAQRTTRHIELIDEE